VEDQSAPIPEEITSELGGIILIEDGRSMRTVEGNRSNRRWALSSALKFKELLWRPKCQTSGLGNRSHYPTPAYSDSLRPTPAKVSSKLELWLELAGIGWSDMELSTK
jgi:hypothetical protein